MLLKFEKKQKKFRKDTYPNGSILSPGGKLIQNPEIRVSAMMLQPISLFEPEILPLLRILVVAP